MQEINQRNLTKEDIKVLKFLSQYKLLKVEDASIIYKTKRYYRQRVNKLIDKEFVKRYKSYIMLDKRGRKILNLTGSNYIKNIKNNSYMERLTNIASIATLTIDSENVEFIPSWNMKDKEIWTETARKYIGVLKVNKKEYLVYYISSKKEHVYIKQLLFDINKTRNYKNIIIFVENFDSICKRYSNLAFDKENTYVIVNNAENRRLIQNYCNIDFHEVLEDFYKEELLISNWDKANYLIDNYRYVINMIFINTKKVEELNWFYKENSNININVDVVTLKENEKKLREILNNKCNIKVIDRNLIGGISEM